MLAFPCNQFGSQEPGTDAEILAFAREKQGAHFPMFSKIEVNGDGAAELYKWLKSEQPGEGDTADITWNFEKFIIDRSGAVIERHSPVVDPADLVDRIHELVS